ncbi:TPA: hypothetical protein ACJ5DT_002456 [Legionella pneumophila]|uniref:Uncharacterized protein n=1 Tax=Legionella pneumophila TaxID=446 RepID=A0A2S6F7N3_LEGPN|nr:hypothetical protein [Legionella pneumophila]APF02036.1 hypothetical protein BIZ52_01060 [Legionella pneumophila subsp. fraseri]APF05047.1 hypothetical protein BIZ51_01060 [Legionella pneumophila subsp. fraseri]AUB67519.1 hypothetical protein BJK09_01065 [Legionella pneumophila]AUB70492.1 hypothetical protein BJK08_01065 [Legionella pneumophila]KXB24455.1 hypothetical protein PtVF66_10500 [Legionella pneumophila]
MTPLFPQRGQIITIKQGRSGVCFLLACLDCLLNGETEGADIIREKFKQTKSGVIVRIKRTDNTMKVHWEKMTGKYIYSYDPRTDEDVIFIDNEKLKEIDNSKKGTSSNSLAVKILERISAYYYQVAWDGDSLLAHKLHPKFHNNPIAKQSDTAFLAKLLGVQVTVFHDPDRLIKLKTINPKIPVYVGMNFGKPDRLGKYRRHALRVGNIKPLEHGEFEVTLINPWNNQEQTTYLLSDLRQRKCQFAVFDSSPQKKLLTEIFLEYKTEIGNYIFHNKELAFLLCEMKQCGLLDSDFAKHPLSSCLVLYKKLPNLVANYKSLPYSERYNMLMCVVNSNGNVSLFKKLMQESSVVDTPSLDRLPQRVYPSAKSFFADLFASLEASLERVHYNDLLKALRANYGHLRSVNTALNQVENRQGIYSKMELRNMNQRLERLGFFMKCHTGQRDHRHSDLGQQSNFCDRSTENLNAKSHQDKGVSL